MLRSLVNGESEKKPRQVDTACVVVLVKSVLTIIVWFKTATPAKHLLCLYLQLLPLPCFRCWRRLMALRQRF